MSWTEVLELKNSKRENQQKDRPNRRNNMWVRRQEIWNNVRKKELKIMNKSYIIYRTPSNKWYTNYWSFTGEGTKNSRNNLSNVWELPKFGERFGYLSSWSSEDTKQNEFKSKPSNTHNKTIKRQMKILKVARDFKKCNLQGNS